MAALKHVAPITMAEGLQLWKHPYYAEEAQKLSLVKTKDPLFSLKVISCTRWEQQITSAQEWVMSLLRLLCSDSCHVTLPWRNRRCEIQARFMCSFSQPPNTYKPSHFEVALCTVIALIILFCWCYWQ